MYNPPPPGHRSSLNLLWKEAATGHFPSMGSSSSQLNLFRHAIAIGSRSQTQEREARLSLIQFLKLPTCFSWEQQLEDKLRQIKIKQASYCSLQCNEDWSLQSYFKVKHSPPMRKILTCIYDSWIVSAFVCSANKTVQAPTASASSSVDLESRFLIAADQQIAKQVSLQRQRGLIALQGH